MFGDIGVPELLIILAVVVLLFGVGRVGRLGKDLGTSVREFRKAVAEDKEETTAESVPAPMLQTAPLPLPAPDHTAAAVQPDPRDQSPPAVF
jgi:sec-independent protein translocase protein TatA